MRTAFHERMDALTAQLGDMCGLVGIAMEHATQALLQADLPLAEQVITDHDRLTAMRARAEENAEAAARLTWVPLQQAAIQSPGWRADL